MIQGLIRVSRWGLAASGLLALGALVGCSSAPSRPEPAPLAPDPKSITVREAWNVEAGEIGFPLQVQAVGNVVAVASGSGQVSVLDVRTGEMVWRADVGQSLTAGVGHDGRVAAVMTVGNELVALADGRELWRQRMTAPSYTAPLVAGARVFVLGADRTVSAFDGQTGRRLWSQPRSGEALILRQPGYLSAVGETLVVGLAGRLVGMNPLNGVSRWEVPVATPRGTNDVERLVDMVAGGARQGAVVCARAFQAAVGCVDGARGALLWSKPAAGASGLTGTEDQVYGVEFDGTVVAWRRADGERAWSMNQLRYRRLTAPALMGPALVVGDEEGRLHFLARDDGHLLARFEVRPSAQAVLTVGDGAPVNHYHEAAGLAIAATPLLAGRTLVVVTHSGRVLGLRAD